MDAVLEQCIAKFIEKEAEGATSQKVCPLVEHLPGSEHNTRQHGPKLVRFPQSMLAPSSINTPATQSATRNTVVMHAISAPQESDTIIRLFGFGDLPREVIERVLLIPRSTVLISSGRTCRSAIWDPNRREYVFNGLLGQSTKSPPPSRALYDRLAALKYVPLGSEPIGIAEKKDGPSSHAFGTWISPPHKDRDNVQQFLQDVDEATEFEDLNTAPETPADARGFQSLPYHQTVQQGRRRLPKPAGPEIVKPVAAEDSDSPQVAESKTSFFDLLRAKDPTAAADDDEDENNSSSSEELVKESIQFHELLQQPTPGVVRKGSAPDARSKPNSVPELANTDPQPPYASTLQLPPALKPPPSAIPEYSRTYAKVDQIGLKGEAGNQAMWELENPSPRRTRKHHGVLRRPPASGVLSSLPSNQSSDNASPSSDMDAPQKCRKPMPKSAAGAGSKAFSNDASGIGVKLPPQPWESIVARPSGVVDGLIDTSIAPLPRPGVESPEYENQFPSLAKGKGKNGVSSLFARPSSKSRQPTHDRAEEKIVERLQPPDEPLVKKNTMRQKAAKKKKQQASKGNAAKPMPQLELPDPPPKPNQSNGPSKTSIRRQAKKEKSKANDQVPYPTDGIEQLFVKVMEDPDAADAADADAVIKFGILLMRECGYQGLEKDTQKVKAMQKQLQQASRASPPIEMSLLPRMTTSDDDALTLLSMLLPDDDTSQSPTDQDLHSHIEYEIVVVLPTGGKRSIEFDQSTPHAFTVRHHDSALGKLCMHYPRHVWDAELSIERPTLDNSIDAAVKNLIASIRTADTAPSIHALVPVNDFTIERVFTKRVFSHTVGVELRVSEVQDLQLASMDPINHPESNFQATASSKEMMQDMHRMWWECCIRLPAGECKAAAELMQDMVNTMVSKMDGVGLHNKGPWYKPEGDPAADMAKPPPFW